MHASTDDCAGLSPRAPQRLDFVAHDVRSGLVSYMYAGERKHLLCSQVCYSIPPLAKTFTHTGKHCLCSHCDVLRDVNVLLVMRPDY